MFRRKQASHFNSDDSEQRQAKINELRATLGPMSARGEKYCSEACLARYLKARNWNVDKSRKMLEKCLKWRAVSRPEDIRWPDISVEAETGKMYTATFADREGRAVVIMRPAKQGSCGILYIPWRMQFSACLRAEGLDKMVWLIDFTGWTLANATPIKTARDSANILQNHYPERLSVAFLFNPPKVFEAFFKGAAPLRPSKRVNREALEAAPSGIVSGLDLGRLISSRSGGSLRKVTAEAAAAGARVFVDLHDALPDPLN
ncbi:hypothetical protein ZWY2020_029220 [Hordeum vulgare]|nr:hypothetical protein ZWY2020_029220 [Hordeum vulgare]